MNRVNAMLLNLVNGSHTLLNTILKKLKARSFTPVFKAVNNYRDQKDNQTFSECQIVMSTCLDVGALLIGLCFLCAVQPLFYCFNKITIRNKMLLNQDRTVPQNMETSRLFNLQHLLAKKPIQCVYPGLALCRQRGRAFGCQIGEHLSGLTALPKCLSSCTFCLFSNECS